MKLIDLHVHTTASDSTSTPDEVVNEAVAAGLSAIAITDHDNTSGCKAAVAAGAAAGLEVIEGIEISTKHQVAVHILGYGIDSSAPAARQILDFVVEDRENRNKKIAALMAADGINITYKEMQQRFGDVIGRPHFARILVEQGMASSVNDAFRKYVDRGQKYYVPRTILPIETAVEMIADSGGVPVLAHPFQYRKNDNELRELISLCMDHGLRGIECRYTGYDKHKVKYLETLANEYRLIKTGGSDYHGANKPGNVLGVVPNGSPVPYEYLAILKEEIKKQKLHN